MELVIPALAGLIGVALGALLTRRTEHGRWLRDARQVAYANYDTAYGNVIGLIFGEERADHSAVEGADDELKGCLSNVRMVGSSEAISCAASIHIVLTAAIVSVLHDPEQFLVEQGVQRPLEEYLWEANEHRDSDESEDSSAGRAFSHEVSSWRIPPPVAYAILR